MTSFLTYIKDYFDNNKANAYELYGQIYGNYPFQRDNGVLTDGYKIEYNEQRAINLVKAGLPNAYENFTLAKFQLFIYFIFPIPNLVEWTTTIENMYNDSKIKGKLALAKAIEDAGYLDVPENIELEGAKVAIEKNIFTKQQLIRCTPEKVKLLTSENTIKAISKGIIDAKKLYEFDIKKIKTITHENTNKALEKGAITFEYIEKLDQPREIEDLPYLSELKAATAASSKVFFFAASGKKEFLEQALAANDSPNTSDDKESPLSTSILSRFKLHYFSNKYHYDYNGITHLLISKGAYFNHYDFARTDKNCIKDIFKDYDFGRTSNCAQDLIYIMPKILSEQELKQVLSHFEPASANCEKEIQGYCLKTIGNTTLHDEL